MTDISTYDFLAHFGVKGMKWGVRKGNKSKSSLGKRIKKATETEKPELEKKIKAFTLTTLALYGGYSVYSIARSRNHNKKVDAAIKKAFSPENIAKNLNTINKRAKGL